MQRLLLIVKSNIKLNLNQSSAKTYPFAVWQWCHKKRRQGMQLCNGLCLMVRLKIKIDQHQFQA